MITREMNLILRASLISLLPTEPIGSDFVFGMIHIILKHALDTAAEIMI